MRCIFSLLIASGWLVMAPSAHAAVALCKPLAVGETYQATSELDARRAALESWSRIAEGHGAGFTRWQLAWERRIECARTADGKAVACQASGRPCTISQVPVEGLPVLSRGQTTDHYGVAARQSSYVPAAASSR